MLIFLIPLKHHENCIDYNKIWKRLDCTLYSCTQQTSNNYHIFVACSKILSLNICNKSEKVTFVKTNLPPLSIKHERPKEHYSNSEIHKPIQDEIAYKRRICIDAALGKFSNISYFMIMDADDFISPKLVEFVENNINPLWLINKGILLSDKNYTRNTIKAMHILCGSTVIITPSFLLPKLYDVRYLGNHMVYHSYNQKKFIPFAACAYSLYDENYSSNLYKRRPLLESIINKDVQKEFGIPSEYLDINFKDK